MEIYNKYGLFQLSQIVYTANVCITNKWLFFSLLPGGNYNGSSYNNLGSNGNWWSSTQNSSTNTWNRRLNYDNGNVNRNNNNKTNGYSIRCLRDLLNFCFIPACCWAGFHSITQALTPGLWNQNNKLQGVYALLDSKLV